MSTLRQGPPASFGAALRRWARRMAALTVGFASVWLLYVLVAGIPVSTAARPERQRPAGVDPVEVLVQQHHCWRGQAPANAEIPRHAVVTLPGRQPEVVASQVGFDIWLEGAPGRLHAFCR